MLQGIQSGSVGGAGGVLGQMLEGAVGKEAAGATTKYNHRLFKVGTPAFESDVAELRLSLGRTGPILRRVDSQADAALTTAAHAERVSHQAANNARRARVTAAQSAGLAVEAGARQAIAAATRAQLAEHAVRKQSIRGGLGTGVAVGRAKALSDAALNAARKVSSNVLQHP
eukprot:Hpha_TRINITY_DN24691_c0_g1::TRINITY_DN24691_c0_g1_i1::g.147450::m.147450